MRNLGFRFSPSSPRRPLPPRPSCSSSSRSTSSPPTCSTNIGRASRRAGAAVAAGVYPQRLSGPCRERDLPGPFDDPDRQPPGADRDHRQCLVRPVAGAQRQGGLLRRGRDQAGIVVDRLHRVGAAPESRDAGRAVEGVAAPQPHRHGRGQGSIRGHDDRAAPRPALVLERQGLRHRPRQARAGNGRAGQRAHRRDPRRGLGAARRPAGVRAAIADHPDRGRRQARRRGSLPAQGGRGRGVPRIPRPRPRHPRPGRRPRQRDEAWPRRRARRARDRIERDRLCRAHVRHRRRGDVPPAGGSSTRCSGISSTISTIAGSIMPWS